MNVFVYGTLMRSERSNYILGQSRYIGKGKLKNYDMYQVASYPGIVNGTGEIVGEVYSVNTDMLKVLDRYECEGRLYIRKLEKIEVENKNMEAFVYVWNGSVEKSTPIFEMPWNERKFV
ncbi:gamma-glutamylcyclotransferase [Clostridium sp. 19966]|uniref:gamma-glutamylcyclotransferase family protein n=1 Tax=Clostridium sp. 19966 TaxID=2768166 RepID=UPI0028DD572D|nr:gamma-glutamylcyclotransferase family protein [Clostridium sp. 19966]MDT8718279.1 gamma-glutamylcyclotransferase [Clostridium sp. 19966]